MHTDDYEISLFREVGVCNWFVRKHQQLLDTMEMLHGMTTATFMDRKRLGELPPIPDFKKWQETVEALQHWSATRDEYERLLDIMKISAS